MSADFESAISIRRRLLVLLLPSLLALMLVGVFAHYRAAMLVVREVSDQRLKDAVRNLASRIRESSRSIDESLQRDASLWRNLDIAANANSLGDLSYAVRTSTGKLLAGNPWLPVLPGGSVPALANVTLQGKLYRVASYRLKASAQDLVISAAERDAVRAGLGHFVLASTWLVDFIQVDVTLLLVWIGVQYGLRPLIVLRRQIESRSPHELQPLRAAEVPSEVKPLVDALNLLFEMLRESARSQRQFVADTAHQLRTPIAGLMGQLELLLDDPDAASLRKRLTALQDGLTRLAHSTNQLLALARTDPAANLGRQLEPVDLATLVGKVVELHVDRAAESGHDLGVEAQSAAVSGDPRQLEDLLGNLIDNALSHTPHGCRITVRCGLEIGRPFLEVEDEGPGIPAPERAKVRQRFYRIPGTRGRGCGLGLSIVDEIARQHKAVLIIDGGRSGTGTLIRVVFENSVTIRRSQPQSRFASVSETRVTL